MARMQPESSWESPDNAEEEFTPLTAQQVQDLRRIQPLLSVWRVVAAQIGVGLLVALVSWGVSGKTSVGVSAGYGALAVVIPAALFARGLTRRMNSLHAGAAVLGFFVWEVVKIALTVAMLALATRVIDELSWPAMLVGLVVTMKVYWVALAWRRVFHPQVKT
ncbi:MAG: ATP synthase subunit I [Betaproteobacteria bacterium]|jgi:ATP synthase protein I|nr:ATP synthase subunit I [Betaproteobacteria bacterium]